MKKLKGWKSLSSMLIFLLGISLMIMGGGQAAFAEKNEIVFGFSTAITGALSYAGMPSKKGYEAWAEMVNAEGGIYVKELGKKLPIRLIYYDDKTDPTTGARIYEKLITHDKVDFLLSPWGSSIGFAVSQVVQKYKMPVVFIWISSDPIYKQGYDYVFGCIPPATQTGWAGIDVLTDKKVVKGPPEKFYFVTAKELYPKTADRGAMEHARELGFKNLYYEEVEKGCKDFTPIITKMKKMGVDGVFTSTYYADFFVLYRQIMELGFRPKFVYSAHSDLIDFPEAFGAKAVEGVCSHGLWSDQWSTFENKKFVQAYKKKWGEEPNQWAVTAVSGQLMKQAIEKAGTLDKEKVKRALEEGEFETMLYPVKYANVRGYTNLNTRAFAGLLQWQNGKLLFVYPDEVSVAKFIYPMPWAK